MISKNKQKGHIIFLMMITFFLFFTISLFSASFVIKKEEPVIKQQETVIAKKEIRNELIQPVVTEIKDYRRQPNNGGMKVTPVITPKMRTEPIQPVAPEPVTVTPTPAPIIEQTENHYHFEDLNTGLIYLGSVVLAVFGLFYSFKGLGKLVTTLTIKKAIKNSKLIMEAFTKDVNNINTYLDYSRKHNDQLSLNKLIIEQYNNNYYARELKIYNEHLSGNLSFIERMFVAEMGHDS